jgi:hypothetical protein
MKKEPTKHFRVDEQGVLWFDDHLIVPKDRELKNKLMDEAHLSKLSIHPRSSKIYQELRPRYWWTKMKKEIAAYVARCDTCCRVKALHMRPAGLLQPLLVPDWKYDDISMDFITSLPTTQRRNDLILVIVDRLTKSTHFLPVKTSFQPPQYAEKYIVEIIDCMVYRRLSCLTEDHSLQLIFGNIYIKVWVLVSFVVQLTTHRQMGR